MRPSASVFISWSGEQTKQLGHALKEFLDSVFAGHITTFLSDADIAPGERFLGVIASNLSSADIGILLVTRENQAEPWLLFEAGALAGKAERGSVIPVLVGLDRAELISPLDQFQNVLGTSEPDIQKLLKRVHLAAGAQPPQRALDLLVDDGWPLLEEALLLTSSSGSGTAPTRRDAQELLEEIHLAVNALVRRDNPPTGWTSVPIQQSPHARVRDNGDLQVEVGNRIVHDDFGPGVVQALVGEGAKRVAHVRFESVGAKKLLVKIAPISLEGTVA